MPYLQLDPGLKVSVPDIKIGRYTYSIYAQGKDCFGNPTGWLAPLARSRIFAESKGIFVHQIFNSFFLHDKRCDNTEFFQSLNEPAQRLIQYQLERRVA